MNDLPERERRAFLKLLPAGAVGAALAGRTTDAIGAAPEIATDLPLAWSELPTDGARTRPLDASRIERGDAAFHRLGARLRLHGLFPSAHLWAYTGLGGFDLEVIYDPERDLRQFAWCCENRHAANVSAGLSLRVPVLPGRGLNLAGAIRDRDGRREAFHLNLSTGTEPGRAKLRRGLYLAALAPGRRIDWRAYRLDTDLAGNGMHQLYRRDAEPLLDNLAPFPYLAFTIDHDRA